MSRIYRAWDGLASKDCTDTRSVRISLVEDTSFGSSRIIVIQSVVCAEDVAVPSPGLQAGMGLSEGQICAFGGQGSELQVVVTFA
jgi:hypothetical protein